MLLSTGKKFEDDKTEAKVKSKAVPAQYIELTLTTLKKVIQERKVTLRIQFEVQNLIELREVSFFLIYEF